MQADQRGRFYSTLIIPPGTVPQDYKKKSVVSPFKHSFRKVSKLIWNTCSISSIKTRSDLHPSICQENFMKTLQTFSNYFRTFNKPEVDNLRVHLLIFVPSSPMLQHRMTSNPVECESLLSFPLEKEGLLVILQHWSSQKTKMQTNSCT